MEFQLKDENIKAIENVICCSFKGWYVLNSGSLPTLYFQFLGCLASVFSKCFTVYILVYNIDPDQMAHYVTFTWVYTLQFHSKIC